MRPHHIRRKERENKPHLCSQKCTGKHYAHIRKEKREKDKLNDWLRNLPEDMQFAMRVMLGIGDNDERHT